MTERKLQVCDICPLITCVRDGDGRKIITQSRVLKTRVPIERCPIYQKATADGYDIMGNKRDGRR